MFCVELNVHSHVFTAHILLLLFFSMGRCIQTNTWWNNSFLSGCCRRNWTNEQLVLVRFFLENAQTHDGSLADGNHSHMMEQMDCQQIYQNTTCTHTRPRQSQQVYLVLSCQASVYWSVFSIVRSGVSNHGRVGDTCGGNCSLTPQVS